MRVVDYATLKGDGKSNQDRYLIGDYYAAVLDGASAYPPQPEGRDGGWYAEQLAREIERAMSPAASLENVLAKAIQEVASANALVPGESPSSTVALTRWSGDEVDCLVLGDSSIVVTHRDGSAEHLIDRRLADVAKPERLAYRRRLAEGHGYDDHHRELLAKVQKMQRRRRNRDCGYWIAEADPAASQHALQGTFDACDVASVLLLTDGASTSVEPMRRRTWASLPQAMRAAGCAQFLSAAFAEEEADASGRFFPRSKRHDDKTVVLVVTG